MGLVMPAFARVTMGWAFVGNSRGGGGGGVGEVEEPDGEEGEWTYLGVGGVSPLL